MSHMHNYFIKFMEHAALEGNDDFFFEALESLVPKLPAESKVTFDNAISKYSLSSPSARIRNYAKETVGHTEESAYRMIKYILENGFEVASEAIINDILSNIGDHSLIAVIELMNDKCYKSIDLKLRGLQKSALIMKIISNYSGDKAKSLKSPTRSFTQPLGFDQYITNEAVQAVLGFIQNADYSARAVAHNLLFGVMSKPSGVNQTLSAHELPRIESGIIINPELYIASVNLNKNSEIPVLVPDGKSLEGAIRRHDTDGRVYLNASQGQSPHVSFSHNEINSDRFYVMADFQLICGVSVPLGYSLVMVKPEMLSDFSIGEYTDEMLYKAEDVIGSLWINPIQNLAHQLNRSMEKPSVTKFIDTMCESSGFRESVKDSPRCSRDFLQHLLNVYASGRSINPLAKSSFASYKRTMRIYAMFFTEFDILPNMADVFFDSKETIEHLHAAGVRFTDRFCPLNIPKSIADTLGVHHYRMIAEMGGSVNVKELPETIDEALKMASKRRAQPMYTGLLSAYPFDALLALCSKHDEFMVVYQAYPERSKDLVYKAPASVKAKILRDDMELGL